MIMTGNAASAKRANIYGDAVAAGASLDRLLYHPAVVPSMATRTVCVNMQGSSSRSLLAEPTLLVPMKRRPRPPRKEVAASLHCQA
jgi:hypothetical protein